MEKAKFKGSDFVKVNKKTWELFYHFVKRDSALFDLFNKDDQNLKDEIKLLQQNDVDCNSTEKEVTNLYIRLKRKGAKFKMERDSRKKLALVLANSINHASVELKKKNNESEDVTLGNTTMSTANLLLNNQQALESGNLENYISEKKSEYELYHSSLTSAVQEVERYIAKKGYTTDPDEMFTKIGAGPRKPSEGKTNKYTLTLFKNGKEQRKAAHFQVYNRGNSIPLRMELNLYIS